MKTKIIVSILTLSFLTLSIGFKSQSTNVEINHVKAAKTQSAQKSTTTDLKLQFPVISDIHIGPTGQDTRFSNTLIQLKKIAPNYNAIALVGDLTDTGFINEYDSFMSVLNKNSISTAQKVITMGNHEYFQGVHNPSTGLTDTDLKNRFISKTGMTGVYYDKWVNGYHFIALSGEESNITNPNDGDNAIISDTQYTWLQNTIAQDTAANKPIFVFLHQPIENTTFGSELWGGLHDNRLSDILKQYPQTVLFSGHTHYLLSNPKTVYQDGFTMVNDGGLLNTYYDGGYGPNIAQGLLVNVYSDRVEIKARDFTNGTWVNSYIIKTPFEKTIYDDQQPVFLNTADAMASNITANSATLTWNIATDNKEVDKYIVKQNGTVISTDYTKFWLTNTTGTESINLSGLTGATAYNLQIYAVDSWGNVSNTPINATFNTL